MRVWGAPGMAAAGGDAASGSASATSTGAGAGITAAHGAIMGQWLGMPGTWQGAASGQGISSPDEDVDEVSTVDAMSISGMAIAIPPASIPLPADMPDAKPPAAIARWRRKRLARSTAERRERIMVRG